MIASAKKIKNYQLVTIPTVSTSNKYYFPDLPNLREVRVSSIVSFHRGLLPRDIYNVQPVTNSDFRNVYITLVTGAEEVVQTYDLTMLNPISAGGAISTFGNAYGNIDLNGLVINFSKSYVQFPGGSYSIPAADFSFVFGIYYEYINQ